MSSPVITIATEADRLAWLSRRNEAFAKGGKLPGWEAHVHTFTPHTPAFPNMGGDISGRAILVGDDRDAVEQAAASYPATDRAMYEHGADLFFRGAIGGAA